MVEDMTEEQSLDFLELFDRNVHDAYKIYENESDNQCIPHWPLSNIDKHSVSNVALPPKRLPSDDSNDRKLISKLLVKKKFKCTNVACGNELEATVHTGLDGHTSTEQHDQLTLRSVDRPDKCTKCRSVLEEIVEDRVVESVQFANCSSVGKRKLQHSVTVALPSHLVSKLELGEKFIVHGYAECSVDGGFLQRLNSDPKIYIQARSIEDAKRTHGISSVDSPSLFNLVDDLITSLQFGEVMTPLWRQLSLLLLVSHASCFSETLINLLIVTDDTNMVFKLLSNLPRVQSFDLDSDKVQKVKSYDSRHVQGGSYTITTASQMQRDGCMFIENLETLKPSELNSILSKDRSCGLIACCPFRFVKKIATVSSEFDLVISLDNLSSHDHLVSASLIWSSRNPLYIQVLEPYFSDGQLPLQCETLLKEYFVASRSVIGLSNDEAIFPIYDPSRQQSLGIHLTKVFQAIRSSNDMSRDDVFMSLIIQEINLMQRLGSSVFQEKPSDWNGAVMPSPCPSVDARVPFEPTSTETGSFQNRYGFIIRDLQSQLNL